MALQYVVKAPASEVKKALLRLSEHIEVFGMEDGLTGMSVPTKVVDTVGERAILSALANRDAFDLYRGEWIGRNGIPAP